MVAHLYYASVRIGVRNGPAGLLTGWRLAVLLEEADDITVMRERGVWFGRSRCVLGMGRP
jgi:hypothetical protein